MAEKLGLARDAAFNRTAFFPDYLRLCDDGGAAPPEGSRIITSDDVFAWMLDLRALNDGIDRRREEVFAEYADARYAHFQLHSLEDLRAAETGQRRPQQDKVPLRPQPADGQRPHPLQRRERLPLTSPKRSPRTPLYLLDEPENSLAPARQLELAGFLQDAARFFRLPAGHCHPLALFCWRCRGRRSTIWTPTRPGPAAGPSWKTSGLTGSFLLTTPPEFETD